MRERLRFVKNVTAKVIGAMSALTLVVIAMAAVPAVAQAKDNDGRDPRWVQRDRDRRITADDRHIRDDRRVRNDDYRGRDRDRCDRDGLRH